MPHMGRPNGGFRAAPSAALASNYLPVACLNVSDGLQADLSCAACERPVWAGRYAPVGRAGSRPTLQLHRINPLQEEADFQQHVALLTEANGSRAPFLFLSMFRNSDETSKLERPYACSFFLPSMSTVLS